VSRAARTRMRADLDSRCILTSSSRLISEVVPVSIHSSSSRNSSSKVVNKTSEIKTGSSIRLKSSKCIAETTIMVGKTSSRRTITRRPQLLSNRPSPNKRSNVQSKVNCQTPTKRSHTPTKGKTNQTREDRSQTHSLRPINKSWPEQTSHHLMVIHQLRLKTRQATYYPYLRCLCRQCLKPRVCLCRQCHR